MGPQACLPPAEASASPSRDKGLLLGTWGKGRAGLPRTLLISGGVLQRERFRVEQGVGRLLRDPLSLHPGQLVPPGSAKDNTGPETWAMWSFTAERAEGANRAHLVWPPLSWLFWGLTQGSNHLSSGGPGLSSGHLLPTDSRGSGWGKHACPKLAWWRRGQHRGDPSGNELCTGRGGEHRRGDMARF